MSQTTLGTGALRAAPAPEPTETISTIFERLPITSAEPFDAPRLRLVVQEHAEGGRRKAAVAGASRRRPAPVRLTRRGRVVVVVFLALLATAALFAVGLVPSQASPSVAPASGGAVSAGVSASGSSVVVQPGESLWSIATRVAPSVDPRVEVGRLIERNGLAGTEIQAGQVLVVP